MPSSTGDHTSTVVLGHSYGGAVITEAEVHAAVRHLVYLCASALGDGEACARAATDEAAAVSISHEARPSLGVAMINHDDGTSTLTRDGARAYSPFVNRPDLVGELLVDIARRSG